MEGFDSAEIVRLKPSEVFLTREKEHFVGIADYHADKGNKCLHGEVGAILQGGKVICRIVQVRT